MADDGTEVARALEAMAISGSSMLAGVMATEGARMLADVKRRAARPRTAPSVKGLGPRLQTGDYNRSIGLRVTGVSKTVRGSVGTNAVQGKRLEFGFEAPGARTLRHPHFGPALDTEAPIFEAALGNMVAELFRSTKG